MHPQGVIWILGVLVLLFSVGMMTPALVSLYYHTGHAMDFMYSSMIVAVIGAAMVLNSPKPPAQLGHRDGFMIVALAWTVLSILGSIPFLMTNTCDHLVDALFESTSGLTTTGATILTGLDQMPASILFWRSMLQWLGGMGIIVLAVAVMPLLGIGGMQLFRAETPGPVKDKLTSKVTETAKALWFLYLGLTLVCALVYGLAGMTAFDAVNHAMCTIAIGGFSTHDASFGYFEASVLRYSAIVFMFLAGMSFTLHFTAWRHRHPLWSYWQDEECRTYIIWFMVLFVLLSLLAVGQGFASFEEVLFNMVSIASTTGFAVSDYSQWPPGTVMLFLIAMFVGACAGSTGGGMKVVRVLMLFRQGSMEVRRLIHPHAVLPLKLGSRCVDTQITTAVWGFAVLFLVCYLFIATLLAFSGVDVITAFSASAACITNTGPGFGDVGPASTYAELPVLAKLSLLFSMILGRLEVYSFFVLLVPEFWRR